MRKGARQTEQTNQANSSCDTRYSIFNIRHWLPSQIPRHAYQTPQNDEVIEPRKLKGRQSNVVTQIQIWSNQKTVRGQIVGIHILVRNTYGLLNAEFGFRRYYVYVSTLYIYLTSPLEGHFNQYLFGIKFSAIDTTPKCRQFTVHRLQIWISNRLTWYLICSQIP